MSTSENWLCGCGEEGKGETAAQRHAATCEQMGYPWCNPSWPRPAVPHDHSEYVEGCFRCDLSRAEVTR